MATVQLQRKEPNEYQTTSRSSSGKYSSFSFAGNLWILEVGSGLTFLSSCLRLLGYFPAVQWRVCIKTALSRWFAVHCIWGSVKTTAICCTCECKWLFDSMWPANELVTYPGWRTTCNDHWDRLHLTAMTHTTIRKMKMRQIKSVALLLNMSAENFQSLFPTTFYFWKKKF